MHRLLLAAAILLLVQVVSPLHTQAATPGPIATLQAAAKAASLAEPAACVRRRVCGPRGCAWRTVCGRGRW